MPAASEVLRQLVAAGVTDVYPCPCRAVGQPREEQPDVFVIRYEHDDDCPVLVGLKRETV